jgi:hypothetical protein
VISPRTIGTEVEDYAKRIHGPSRTRWTLIHGANGQGTTRAAALKSQGRSSGYARYGASGEGRRRVKRGHLLGQSTAFGPG